MTRLRVVRVHEVGVHERARLVWVRVRSRVRVRGRVRGRVRVMVRGRVLAPGRAPISSEVKRGDN